MQLPARRVNVEDLFLNFLSEENRVRLRTRQPIVLTGSRGTTFLMYYGHSSIVRELTHDGQYYIGWCAYADLPYHTENSAGLCYTSMLAQMLLIQADEDAFRDVAEN